MGTSLTGLTPANTYDALIKVGDNGPIDGTLKTLSDGLGNNLPMEASSTAVNFTNGLQQSGVAVPTAAQVAGKQDTLVSGTNIKTINSTSILGSGNIVTPTTTPSGVAGAIQFSDGSAFASDAANLFWDDTNNRLGVGTNAPTASIQATTFKSSSINDSGSVLQLTPSYNTYTLSKFSIGSGDLPAQLGVKGSGSTSATDALIVQNSSGTTLFSVRNDGVAAFSSVVSGGSFAGNIRADFINSSGNNFTIIQTNDSTGNAIFYQFVAIGTTSAPVASAALDVVSTTKGFLPPRMTDTQRAAIATPAEGLLLFNTTNKGVAYRDGTNWGYLSGAPQTVAASGGTVNVSFASGNIINMTLTASTTLTFSGHVVGTYIFELIQGGSGSYTITWPASVKWSGGTAPTLTTTVGKTDIVTLFHDGTNFYGTYSLNY